MAATLTFDDPSGFLIKVEDKVESEDRVADVVPDDAIDLGPWLTLHPRLGRRLEPVGDVHEGIGLRPIFERG